MERTVNAQRLEDVAILHASHQFRHFGRESIGYNRNHSHAAERNDLKGERIVATDHFKTGGCVRDELIDLCQIATCLFDCHDILEIFGQSQSRIGVEVHSGTSRHVVEHHRHGRCLADGTEMPIEPFLRGFVIVRCDDQHPIDPLKVALFKIGTNAACAVSSAA